MVNITDLLIACTQAPGETGPITLVTFCVLIVTENGTLEFWAENMAQKSKKKVEKHKEPSEFRSDP